MDRIGIQRFSEVYSDPKKIVHLKGFGGTLKSNHDEAILKKLSTFPVLIWDGDPYSPLGFTRLVEAYLTDSTGVAVAFKAQDGVTSFARSWTCIIDRFPGRICVCPVDLKSEFSNPSLQSEIERVAANLPGSSREYVALGRIALRTSQSMDIVCLGGGAIPLAEFRASTSARWTIYEIYRNKPETHQVLWDYAKNYVSESQNHNSNNVTLVGLK